MAFDLICSWGNFGNSQNSFDLLFIEIRYANGFNKTLLNQLLHGLPGVNVIVGRVQSFAICINWEQFGALLIAHGPVDQVQIQIFQLQQIQSILTSSFDHIWTMEGVPQLACNEQILAGRIIGIGKVLIYGIHT